MKNREKSDGVANRIRKRKKRPKSGHCFKNNAASLSYYYSVPEKYIRKSAPFLDKNQFANSRAFRVYYQSINAKNNALRAARNALFRHKRRNTRPIFFALAPL